MSIEFIYQFYCREICTKTVRYLQGEDNTLYYFSEASGLFLRCLRESLTGGVLFGRSKGMEEAPSEISLVKESRLR